MLSFLTKIFFNLIGLKGLIPNIWTSTNLTLSKIWEKMIYEYKFATHIEQQGYMPK